MFFCESQFEMKMYCWVGLLQRFLLKIYLEFVVHFSFSRITLTENTQRLCGLLQAEIAG